MSDISKYSMGRVQNIHFVGIGGAGMCGIAEILKNLGYKISGSDLKETNITNHLKDIGINISIGLPPNESSVAIQLIVTVEPGRYSV